MKEEVFDAMFRSKIEANDTAPTWDATKVWQKIEPTQTKKRFVWPYVASILMVISFGIYWVFSFSEQKRQPVLSKSNTKISENNKSQKSTIQHFENKTKAVKRENVVFNQKENVVFNSEVLIKEIVPEEKEVVLNLIQKETPITEEKKAKNPLFEEKVVTVLEQKVIAENHVIVLNIPVEGEEKMTRKKRLTGRFFQQVGRFSNGHKFDWEEVNIRPKKIWVYLKSNFQADSTTYH